MGGVFFRNGSGAVMLAYVAAGRLIGTLMSGLSYQAGGLPLCLATAGGMALASWLSMRWLRAGA